MDEENNRNDYSNKKKKRSVAYPFKSVIYAVIGGLITSVLVLQFPGVSSAEGVYTGNTQQIIITPKDDITTVEAVAMKSMKSVVGITSTDTVEDLVSGQSGIQGVVGSGVIVNSKGYVLTNAHVVFYGNAKNINVMFENGDKKPAKILWSDSILDLAIVKVDGSGYPAADIGDSDKLNIGELAVAIGNPLGVGFERSVTSGIISGLNRTVWIDQYNKLENLIQTNAAINLGNSGGPLLNKRGEVIGINTFKLEATEGLGFAIPINIVKPRIDQVIKDGEKINIELKLVEKI